MFLQEQAESIVAARSYLWLVYIKQLLLIIFYSNSNTFNKQCLDSQTSYVKSLALAITKSGADLIVMNNRGLGGIPLKVI